MRVPRNTVRLVYRFITGNKNAGTILFRTQKFSATARAAARDSQVVFALHSVNDEVVALSQPFELKLDDSPPGPATAEPTKAGDILYVLAPLRRHVHSIQARSRKESCRLLRKKAALVA
eukprot:TRINITY_DN3652_c0_g1_i6.p2 TRINITY_DN3652_c0_g1~~TRINITY_DN3652_c0_g1_i6.p2  ORF type:complete len:119 (+),score=15.09 TRINITY_DN3652_c0_g1_i6:402-758(+)